MSRHVAARGKGRRDRGEQVERSVALMATRHRAGGRSAGPERSACLCVDVLVAGGVPDDEGRILIVIPIGSPAVGTSERPSRREVSGAENCRQSSFERARFIGKSSRSERLLSWSISSRSSSISLAMWPLICCYEIPSFF